MALARRRHAALPVWRQPERSVDTEYERSLGYAVGFQFQGRSSSTVVPDWFTRTMTSAR